MLVRLSKVQPSVQKLDVQVLCLHKSDRLAAQCRWGVARCEGEFDHIQAQS